jgi:type I restriction enzyme S subunit
MSELPNNWIAVTLGELCSKPQYGFTTKSTAEGKVKYLRTTDLTSGKITWDKVPFCITEPDDERYQLEDNDIVISRAGSVGFHCLVKNPPTQAVFASYLIRFKPDKAIFPEYLSFFFKSKDYWEQLKSKAVGVAVQNVNARSLSDLVVPVAPLNEQIRIANKLDSVLAKVDAAQTRLEKIPTLLKRFRQSVLAAAVSGKLTEEWREGKKLNATIIKHNKKLEPIGDNEKYFDAPSSWSWSRLGSVVRLINGDRGKNYPNQSEYVEDGIPFINTGHIEPNGTLSAKRMNFITKEKYDSLGSGKIINNDLVYCLRGATMGKTARVTPFDTGAIASSLVIVRPETLLLTNYCFYFLISPEARKLIKLFDNGSAQPNLSAKSLSMYPIALPSLYEQKEIVRRVESLFTLADTVEKQYLETKKRLDRLTQSLLAKAFRGELVPQDPNDEPAAELLKRIQAERLAQPPVKNKRAKSA